jgi:hypothetical protein
MSVVPAILTVSRKNEVKKSSKERSQTMTHDQYLLATIILLGINYILILSILNKKGGLK